MLATIRTLAVFSFTFINVSHACSNACVCSSDKATCVNPNIEDIVLNENIHEVKLIEFNASKLVSNVFTNATQWTKIQKLDIHANNGTSLPALVFNGLTNLTYLGFHNEHMFDMRRDAFYGLDNVRVLELSGNRRLRSKYLFQSLNTTYLPQLTHLTLTGLQSYYVESIHLDAEFFESIFGYGIHRNITYLDISNVSIGHFNYTAGIQKGFCNSVKHIVMRKNSFQNIFDFNNQPICKSLRIIDFGEAFIPSFAYGISFSNIDFNCRAASFYFNVEEMYMDGFARYVKESPFVENYFLNLTACLMKIRKVSLSNIQAVKFNITVALHTVTENSMEWLSLADNLLGYVNPGFLAPSKNIKYVDVTNNQLHKMQNAFGNEFKEIIKENINLEVFKMASNGLKLVPEHMFKTNAQLKHLDLSRNSLTVIGFAIGHLKDLRELNLSGNNFVVLSENDRNILSALALAKGNTSDFRVDLSNMSYVCSCETENLATIHWIKENMDTYLVGDKNHYKCTLQDQYLFIADDAFDKTTAFCEKQFQNKIVSIIIPVLAVCILIGFFIVFKVRIFRRKRRERQAVIQDIGMDRFNKKFITFLSFCSEDADLVIGKIMPKLNVELQKLTGSSKQMVCSGDRQFKPGYSLGEEIIRCIEESAVIILAVSKSFCIKEWCRKEVQETYDQNKPIVLLFLEKVEPEHMYNVLRKLYCRYAHASWISDLNGERIEPEWSVFCNALLDLTVEASETESNGKLRRLCNVCT